MQSQVEAVLFFETLSSISIRNRKFPKILTALVTRFGSEQQAGSYSTLYDILQLEYAITISNNYHSDCRITIPRKTFMMMMMEDTIIIIIIIIYHQYIMRIYIIRYRIFTLTCGSADSGGNRRTLSPAAYSNKISTVLACESAWKRILCFVVRSFEAEAFVLTNQAT